MHLPDRKTVASLLPAFRDIYGKRRPPRSPFSVFYTRSTDEVELYCTLLERDPRKAVIVAHPAVVGSYHSQVVDLAEELAGSFSVILFDFRGHGRSGGVCPLGFGKPSEDLEAVLDRTRVMGFRNVGVAGFSLGAAAAFLLAARGGDFDSLVSIGCPPRFPDISPLVETPLARAALRLLGMRVQAREDTGPAPVDVASVPGLPKFLIFGEWEVAPPEEIRSFTEKVSEPKRVLTVPGSWHADIEGHEGVIREWFEETLS